MPAGPSFDHLIRPLQERRRDREAESLGGLEVDDQLELNGLFDRKVGGFGALQDLVDIGRGAAEEIREACPISHEAAGVRCFPECEHCWHPVLCGQVYDALVLTVK